MSEKHSTIVSSAAEEISELSTHPPKDSKSNVSHSTIATEDDVLFPWVEGTNQKFSIRAISRFPLMGAVGLIGSALTVILSALVLHFFDGKPVVTGHRPKPAAWLSIVLSLNSVCVHTAVTQGRAANISEMTWWVRATKKRTTLADLHYIWATQDSLWETIRRWNVFNYILFATVMVATLPVNGIILQSAITSIPFVWNSTDTWTNYSIADHLPKGFSATIDPDGSMDLYRYDWQQAIPLIIGNENQPFRQSLNAGTTCKGYCEGTVRAIGFQSQCETSIFEVDLPLDQQQNLVDFTPYNQSAPNVNYTIFDAGIVWDHTIPNGWNLTTIWKNDSSCSANMVKTTCQIQLGSCNYPVAVTFNGTNDGKYDWALRTKDMDIAGDISDPSMEFVSFGPGSLETNNTNSTYGGIATTLGVYFNSSITLNRNNIENTTELKVNGFYAEQLDTHIDQRQFAYRCNISLSTFGEGGAFQTPHDALLEQFRYWLFYTSIYAMEPNTSIWTDESKPAPQQISHDLDSIHVSIYKTNWAWYIASVGITFAIVLLILPTFYGFWKLKGETTLSPFDTARAFHTPILLNQPAETATPDLLKTVGKRSLRTELSSPLNSPANSPPGSPGMQEERFAKLG